MKHYILLSLAVLALAGIIASGSGIFSRISYWPLKQTATVAQSESAVRDAMQVQIFISGGNVTLSTTAISGNYALQAWEDNYEAGQALLRYSAANDEWSLITWGGGAANAQELVGQGVPQADAEALIRDIARTGRL